MSRVRRKLVSAVKFLPLVLKYVVRHRGRSILTVAGTAMFLFYSIEAMQQGVREATQRKSDDVKLVVYRQDRYCPFTSNLPQDYASRIAALMGERISARQAGLKWGIDLKSQESPFMWPGL